MKPKEVVKYLSFTLDYILNWKAPINNNKTKTLKIIETLANLIKST